MSWQALVLVLAAAAAHALWNFHAKRAALAGVPFLWLCTVFGTVGYAPLAAWQIATSQVSIGLTEVGVVLGSAAAHTAYLGSLQRGYAVGDLSVVYPIARGLGPVLAISGAMLVLGERPGRQVLIGALAVCAAVVVFGIAGRAGAADRDTTRALGYAGLTGVAIATYTVVDAYAVTALSIPPLLFTWIGSVIRLTVYTPLVWRRRPQVARAWSDHRGAVIAVATLSPLAYVLVLIAFTLAPISQVAPLRELSIIIGTALGTRLLAEGRGRLRVGAATVVVAGVILVVTG